MEDAIQNILDSISNAGERLSAIEATTSLIFIGMLLVIVIVSALFWRSLVNGRASGKSAAELATALITLTSEIAKEGVKLLEGTTEEIRALNVTLQAAEAKRGTVPAAPDVEKVLAAAVALQQIETRLAALETSLKSIITLAQKSKE